MAQQHLRTILDFVRTGLTRRCPIDTSDADLLDYFARLGEEDAFTAIVRRHGPLVLSVCRRVLSNAADADDAFQATFLVLVRKASSIRKGGSLASWLYGVAYRVALEARTRAARRRVHEKHAQTTGQTKPSGDAVARELRSILDQELEQLPYKYRAPLVLHYLAGQTKEATAQQLGWSEGTVSGRLARARDVLRNRLIRRGITTTSAALSAALAQQIAAADVPFTLTASTARLVAMIAAGDAALAAESVRIVALTKKVVRTMVLSKLKIAAAMLLIAVVGVIGVPGFLYRAQADLPAEQPLLPLAAARPAADPALAGAAGKPDRPLLRVPLPDRTMKTVTLSHDGKLLTVAPHAKTTVQLWNVATGKEQTLKGNPFSVTAMAFSPDGKTLATGTGSWLPDGAPGELKLWNVATAEERATLTRLPSMIVALAFSPDGKTLASADSRGTLKLWDVSTAKERASIRPPADTSGTFLLQSLAFAHNNKTVVGTMMLSWPREGRSAVVLKEWQVSDGKERTILEPTAKEPGQGFPAVLSGDTRVVGLASPTLSAPLVGAEGKLELWECRALAGPPQKEGKDAAETQQRDALDGTWVIVKAEIQGKSALEESDKSTKLTIKDGKLSDTRDSKGALELSKVIDPTKKPKTVTLPYADGGGSIKFFGIYEVKGDELWVCGELVDTVQEKDVEGRRPQKFDSNKGLLLVFKREAAGDSEKKKGFHQTEWQTSSG